MNKKVCLGAVILLFLGGVLTFFLQEYLPRRGWTFTDTAGVIDDSVRSEITTDMNLLYTKRGVSFHIRVDEVDTSRALKERAEPYFSKISTKGDTQNWVAIFFSADGRLDYRVSAPLARRLRQEQFDIHKSMAYIESNNYGNVSRGLYHFFINSVDLLARDAGMDIGAYLSAEDSPGAHFFAQRRRQIIAGIVLFFAAALLCMCIRIDAPAGQSVPPHSLAGGTWVIPRRDRTYYKWLRRFRRDYSSDAVTAFAEAVTAKLIERRDARERQQDGAAPEAENMGCESVLAVFLCSNDAVLNRLAGNSALLLIVTADDSTFLSSESFADRGPVKEDHLSVLILSRRELDGVYKTSPLDIYLFQQNVTLLWGSDILSEYTIRPDEVRAHVSAAIYSTAASLRSTAAVHGRCSGAALIHALGRLYGPFRGILLLRGVSKCTDWSWLISVVESSCSLTDLSLSALVAALEDEDYARLPGLYSRFTDALDRIALKVESM
ncbi:MAG: hypothetical protein ACQEQV_07780 [Fibrobacterota bacterium]